MAWKETEMKGNDLINCTPYMFQVAWPANARKIYESVVGCKMIGYKGGITDKECSDLCDDIYQCA